MFDIKKTFLNKYVLLGSVGVFAISVLAWWPMSCAAPEVQDFDPVQDTAGILQNFKDDWYWLIAEGVQFDPAYMLRERSPNNYDTAYHGKLTIKVIRDNGRLAAFTTYYPKNAQTGWIQFVSVNKDFRSKGYARKLVSYAVNDLFKRGCTEVKLTTRINNVRAQRIYDKFGFVQYKRDDRFVDYVFKKP